MDDMTPFEGRFEERIRVFARSGMRPVDSASIARTVAVSHPRRATGPAIRRLGGEFQQARLRALLAAAAILALVVSGTFLVFNRRPAIVGPNPTPATDPSFSERSAEPTPSVVTGPGVWIPTGTMGTPRHGHAAVALIDGRVLVAGGSDGPNRFLTSAELYDPDTGTWSPTGRMGGPLDVFPATLLSDGRVLVGQIKATNPDQPSGGIRGAEVYDPRTGTWTATGKMLGGSGTATLLRDGKVLVAGGGAELYDPDRGTWTATGRMTTPRHSHAAILLADGRVLVAGGHAPGDDPTHSAELFDPATGSWTAIANMTARREIIVGFLRPDGKVLIVGSSRGEPLSADLFDPATETWTPMRDLANVGSFHSSTSLSDGTMLLVGGGDAGDAAEVFDPATGASTAAMTMLRPHTDAPATLLVDGTVLVAGGRDCVDEVCVATGSAELYVPAGVPRPSLPEFPSPPPPVFPDQTPRPTPYPPATGPIPPNARPWTVTVVNESSQPATLFLAEEGENGIGQLCGSMRPNAVPANTTMQVTFQLPPKSVTDCWIWVNPVPGEGGSLFQTSDAPMPGQVFVTADGQTGWAGP